MNLGTSSRKRQRSPVSQRRSISSPTECKTGSRLNERGGQLTQPCITVFSRPPHIISGANQAWLDLTGYNLTDVLDRPIAFITGNYDTDFKLEANTSKTISTTAYTSKKVPFRHVFT